MYRQHYHFLLPIRKVILSDGAHYLSGILAANLNSLVYSNTISKNCILKVNSFMINTIPSGQKICVLMGAEQVGNNPGNRVGVPMDISHVHIVP